MKHTNTSHRRITNLVTRCPTRSFLLASSKIAARRLPNIVDIFSEADMREVWFGNEKCALLSWITAQYIIMFTKAFYLRQTRPGECKQAWKDFFFPPLKYYFLRYSILLRLAKINTKYDALFFFQCKVWNDICFSHDRGKQKPTMKKKSFVLIVL